MKTITMSCSDCNAVFEGKSKQACKEFYRAHWIKNHQVVPWL